MPVTALSLVLISALMHAIWNLRGKAQLADERYFFWVALCAGLTMLPVIVWVQSQFLPSLKFVALLTMSGICQAAYMIGLARAYQLGDLGWVYPIVRALPVVLVMLIAQVTATPLGPMTIGLILIVIVLTLLLGAEQGSANHGRVSRKLMGWCALVIMGTVGYSLVDQQAMLLLAPLPVPAILQAMYFAGLQLLAAAVFIRLAMWRKPSRISLLEVRSPWLTGMMMMSTYCLILLAMPMVDNVSLIVALRQLSIPLSVVAGIAILKEPVMWRRLTLSAAIAASLGGIALTS
ncbi:EamA family transporter [Salinibius halmophilus]|uniref:hypothetical protein n=1 Tax=Salinibius halmophilus TaxID=1853216 RepID=UPI000E65F11B|nr:hypothetical protein [Salinibius halmophilus]